MKTGANKHATRLRGLNQNPYKIPHGLKKNQPKNGVGCDKYIITFANPKLNSMPQTKFGFSQTERPSPLWYRRLSSALIIFIIPGAIGLVQGWGMTDRLANRWLMILGFAPALIKGIGTLMGNGQVFMPSNEQIDDQAPLNKDEKKP